MMRVVSQNGKFDVPYEQCALTRDGNMIHGLFGGSQCQWLFAQYESQEKAQKAMELLHKEYTGIMPSIVIANDANFDKEDMKVLQNSTFGAFIKPANYGDVEVHMLPRIFRFPDEDEIEVEE